MATARSINTSNLSGLSYESESASFRKLPYPIIDVHSHINGDAAVELYLDAARTYGIGLTYSMTQLELIPRVKEILGETVRFVAVPEFGSKDTVSAFGEGYKARLDQYFAAGARIAKFWCGPRLFDSLDTPYRSSPLRLNSPERMGSMQHAVDLGMALMFHVADPDTWFKSRYVDANKYGSKDDQYAALEEILSRFQVTTMVAHFGGSPESLERLDTLLGRYPHMVIDSSATKWMVRELSKHSPEVLRAFFARHSGRILFGSDIVTAEQHLQSGEKKHEMMLKASSREEAYDLYASRYWALRTLFETDFDGQSPISDPDLAMVEPDRYHPDDAPPLRGMSFGAELLEDLYRNAAERWLGPFYLGV